jgi:hypothetical protein
VGSYLHTATYEEDQGRYRKPVNLRDFRRADKGLFTALDNLIAQHPLPVMIAVSIGNGSGDGPGQR